MTSHASTWNVDLDRRQVKSSRQNTFKLLENGEEYFPAVFAAIDAARREVIVETFILFEDNVGKELHSVLIAAAKRGVSVDLTVDGYGSPDLSPEFVQQLSDAGIRLHIFDPRPRLLGMRINILRRLHRKIAAVDGTTVFIGGINFSADHLLSFGNKAKQDYAVRIEGGIAWEIHRFVQQQAAAFYKGPTSWRERPLWRVPPWWSLKWAANRWPIAQQDSGKAMLVFRDNDEHRDDIERHYRAAIRAAKREVVIANAYFFPGYRLLRQLRHAARRGVKVKLILQGEPDMPQAKTWATLLYPSLLRAGVEIYEYCQRPLHAKVAVIDDNWSTVGSSNLDPLSLALNLEANVIIYDASFNRELRASLEPLLHQHCKRVDQKSIRHSNLWVMASSFVAYHCTRHFPRWAGWLPAHLPKLESVEPARQTKQLSQSGRASS